jgi:hypothetical protein
MKAGEPESARVATYRRFTVINDDGTTSLGSWNHEFLAHSSPQSIQIPKQLEMAPLDNKMDNMPTPQSMKLSENSVHRFY